MMCAAFWVGYTLSEAYILSLYLNLSLKQN